MFGRREARHNYTAFVREDVEDAKRGRPAGELREYAASRGLEWLEDAMVAGFRAAQPLYREYQFNVMRGVLPGGSYGILLHELFQIQVLAGDKAMAGSFASTRYRSPGNRVSTLVGAVEGSRPEPFSADAVWAPCTVAAVHVPEARGVLGSFAIEPKSRYDRRTQREARDFVAATMLRAEPELAEDVASCLESGAAAAAIRQLGGGYFTIEYRHGTLRLRKNGYLTEPEALDAFARAASAIAAELAQICLPLASPRSFDEPLPGRPVWDGVEPPATFADRFQALALRLALEHENPDEFHRAFPTFAAPGCATAVMRGEIPGMSRLGRLVYVSDRPVNEALKVRGCVALAARDRTEPTPPGGIRLPERSLVYEVRDGVTAIWSLETWGWRFSDEDTIVARAAALARDRDL